MIRVLHIRRIYGVPAWAHISECTPADKRGTYEQHTERALAVQL